MKINVKETNDTVLANTKWLFLDMFVGDYPPEHTVSMFFATLSVGHYPQFFEECLVPSGAGRYAHAGFTRGPAKDDPEDPGITDQEVALGGIEMGQAIISLKQFLDISLSLARKVIEVATERNLMEQGVIDNKWMESIHLSIPKIMAQLSAINRYR